MTKMLYENPVMRQTLERWRENYSQQVDKLQEIPLHTLPNFQEASSEDFMEIFDQHVHRYQQAFLYLNKLNLLNSAVSDMNMRSMLLKPCEDAGTPHVPMLRHQDNHMTVLYEETTVPLQKVEVREVFTRLTLRLLPSDPLPFKSGARILQSVHAQAEPVFVTVFPDFHTLLMFWSVSVMDHAHDGIVN